ncbi:MAG: hypothetical protein DRG09_01950 [Epsilonproteobacteria bacterium]|nr:MAG: hypothetical protein DRG09_01950 [Campylobacterota bacterium]
MEISVDISMYPLQSEYEAAISAFIEKLKQEPTVKVSCNELSTQLHGDYRIIMKMLEEEIYSVFKEIPDSIFVLKFVGHNREGRF